MANEKYRNKEITIINFNMIILSVQTIENYSMQVELTPVAS